MRSPLSALFLLLPLLCPLVAGQAQEIECDDSDLTSYLLAIIDEAYDNGLTIFEQYIASLSETESGFDFLQSLHQSETPQTLLAPTDQAFQTAGINPPFTGINEKQLVELLEYHTLSGDYTYPQIPQSPVHGIAANKLGLKEYLNSTVESSATGTMVLQQGDDSNTISVRMANGNGTTWNRFLDLGGTSVDNLYILPIDTIISYPPKLSDAMKLSTSSRSQNGTTTFAAALTAAGGAASLEELTQNGFTAFVPVDDAFTDDIQSALSGDAAKAQTVLGNHYTTSYSLFSQFWTGGSPSPSIKSQSGLDLTVKMDGEDTIVTASNGGQAKILRSDIVLNNGVMHLIDNVLFTPDQAPTTIAGLGTPSPTRTSDKVKGNNGASGSQPSSSPSGGASRNLQGGVGSVILASLLALVANMA